VSWNLIEANTHGKIMLAQFCHEINSFCVIAKKYILLQTNVTIQQQEMNIALSKS
jgi:hypothetical protein